MGKLFIEGLVAFLVGLQFYFFKDAVAAPVWPAIVLAILGVAIMGYSFYTAVKKENAAAVAAAKKEGENASQN